MHLYVYTESMICLCYYTEMIDRSADNSVICIFPVSGQGQLI